jgi:ribosome-associated protein YbcJ (S4-like RNA binding protein)
MLLFIGLKISEPVLKLEPLLMVLELISSGSSLKSLLIKALSAVVQN